MPAGGMQFYTYNDRQVHILNQVRNLGSNAEMTAWQRGELQRANGRSEEYIRELDRQFAKHDAATAEEHHKTMRPLDSDTYSCPDADEADVGCCCCGWWGFWRSADTKRRSDDIKREKKRQARLAAYKSAKFQHAWPLPWVSACAVCNALMTGSDVCAIKCSQRHILHTVCARRLSLDAKGTLQCPCCFELV